MPAFIDIERSAPLDDYFFSRCIWRERESFVLIWESSLSIRLCGLFNSTLIREYIRVGVVRLEMEYVNGVR